MRRRRFLKATGIAAAGALAGCIARGEPTKRGAVFTTDNYTLRVADRFIDEDNNETSVVVDVVNVTDNPQPTAPLVTPELQVGRATHEPTEHTLKSTELVSGELARYTLRYPINVSDKRAVLTLQQQPVLINDPAAEEDSPEAPNIRLGYAQPLALTRGTTTIDDVQVTIEQLPARDHLPIYGERARVTFTNTANQSVTLPATPAVIKGPNGRETTQTLDKRRLAPSESRSVILRHLILDPKRADTAYVGVDLAPEETGTKHLFRL